MADDLAADTATPASPAVDRVTLDARFLTVLRMEGITPSLDGGATTIGDAHGVCLLFDRGEVPQQVGALMTAGGMTDRQARELVGASIAAYCPDYIRVVETYADGH